MVNFDEVQIVYNAQPEEGECLEKNGFIDSLRKADFSVIKIEGINYNLPKWVTYLHEQFLSKKLIVDLHTCEPSVFTIDVDPDALIFSEKFKEKLDKAGYMGIYISDDSDLGALCKFASGKSFSWYRDAVRGTGLEDKYIAFEYPDRIDFIVRVHHKGANKQYLIDRSTTRVKNLIEIILS